MAAPRRHWRRDPPPSIMERAPLGEYPFFCAVSGDLQEGEGCCRQARHLSGQEKRGQMPKEIAKIGGYREEGDIIPLVL